MLQLVFRFFRKFFGLQTSEDLNLNLNSLGHHIYHSRFNCNILQYNIQRIYQKCPMPIQMKTLLSLKIILKFESQLDLWFESFFFSEEFWFVIRIPFFFKGFGFLIWIFFKIDLRLGNPACCSVYFLITNKIRWKHLKGTFS